jgi:hypothetical protein
MAVDDDVMTPQDDTIMDADDPGEFVVDDSQPTLDQGAGVLANQQQQQIKQVEQQKQAAAARPKAAGAPKQRTKQQPGQRQQKATGTAAGRGANAGLGVAGKGLRGSVAGAANRASTVQRPKLGRMKPAPAAAAAAAATGRETLGAATAAAGRASIAPGGAKRVPSAAAAAAAKRAAGAKASAARTAAAGGKAKPLAKSAQSALAAARAPAAAAAAAGSSGGYSGGSGSGGGRQAGYLAWTSVGSAIPELARAAAKQVPGGMRLCVEGHEEGRVSHLLLGADRRTLKLLLGVANGAWLLQPEWLTASIEKVGRGGALLGHVAE